MFCQLLSDEPKTSDPKQYTDDTWSQSFGAASSPWLFSLKEGYRPLKVPDNATYKLTRLLANMLSTYLLLKTMYNDWRILSAEPSEKRRDSHLRSRTVSLSAYKNTNSYQTVKIAQLKHTTCPEWVPTAPLHAVRHEHCVVFPVHIVYFRITRRVKWPYSDTNGLNPDYRQRYDFFFPGKNFLLFLLL